MTLYQITTVTKAGQIAVLKTGRVAAAADWLKNITGWNIRKVRQMCKDKGWAITREIGDIQHYEGGIDCE